jgi:CHASE2 domain-containing sensor protein
LTALIAAVTISHEKEFSGKVCILANAAGFEIGKCIFMKRQEKNKPVTKGIAAAILIIGILLIMMGVFIQGKEWTGLVLRTFSTLGIALVISALVTLSVS